MLEITKRNFRKNIEEIVDLEQSICFVQDHKRKNNIFFVGLRYCVFVLLLYFLIFFLLEEKIYHVLGLLFLLFAIKRFFRLRPCGILVNGSGVAYQNKHFYMLIPWGNISKEMPVFVNEKGNICLNLISDVPGKGFIVKKANFATDDLVENIPLDFIDFQLHFNVQLNLPHSEVVILIRKRKELFIKKIEQCLEKGNFLLPAVAIKESKTENNVLMLRYKEKKYFPTFCPITGGDCECFYLFTDREGWEFPWFVSRSGFYFLKWQKRLRDSSLFVSFFLYVLCGYSMIFFSFEELDVSSLLTKAFFCLFIFFITPISWYLLREKLVFMEENPKRGCVLLRIHDKDYLRAFVDLNVANGTFLPKENF